MSQPQAANAVLFLHVVLAILALAGGFGLLVTPWWMLVHVPIVAWSAAINIAGGTCPLTSLEGRLRGELADRGLDDGFLVHYIGPWVYPGATPRQLERLIGVFVIGWNLSVYLFVWWRLRGH